MVAKSDIAHIREMGVVTMRGAYSAPSAIATTSLMEMSLLIFVNEQRICRDKTYPLKIFSVDLGYVAVQFRDY
uniref:Uncharacterized protein n=1 Tax=viral metagenome TaxID=1070528 RepID=A0A6M3JKT4_9ZZZZ